MDYCIMCINRLCKAAYSLIFFTSFCFAYSPPSVDTPIDFVFDNQSDAVSHSLSQCDSNNLSWRVCQSLTCAVGDPNDVLCVVSMCYYATDVNQCDPDNSPPDGLVTLEQSEAFDLYRDGNGDNQALLDDLHYYTLRELTALKQLSNQTTNVINSSKRQEEILKSILRVTASQADDSGIIEAIRNTEYYNAIRHQTMSEDMLTQEWLSPHLNVLKAQQVESLEADEEQSLQLLANLNNLQDKTRLNGEYLADINLSTAATRGYASNLNRLESIENMTTSMYDNSYDIRRATKDTEENTDELIDLTEDYIDIAEVVQATTNTIKNHASSMKNSLKSVQTNTKTLSDTALNATDLTGQTTSLTESLQAINDTTQAQTDEFNARAAELNGLLESIKSNTAGNGGDPDNPDDGETVTENSCTSFTCTSNSAVCYLARKQWETDCASQAAVLGNDGSLDNLTDKIGQYINDPDSDIKNIEAGTVDTSSFMNKYTDGSGFNVGSDTCPAPYHVDVTITSFTLDLTPFCDLAGVIRWFLVAFASVAAGLMISKFS